MRELRQIDIMIVLPPENDGYNHLLQLSRCAYALCVGVADLDTRAPGTFIWSV
jgi:hypothetical protein